METRPMKGGCVLNWNLRMKLLTVVGIIALLITGCGTSNAPAPKLIVGALHVGSIHDLGYNEAMHEGLLEMQKNGRQRSSISQVSAASWTAWVTFAEAKKEVNGRVRSRSRRRRPPTSRPARSPWTAGEAPGVPATASAGVPTWNPSGRPADRALRTAYGARTASSTASRRWRTEIASPPTMGSMLTAAPRTGDF